MNLEEVSFEQFFAERIKAKGYTLKKLADATGIAPVHIENLLRGDFGHIPSAPYFRGYLISLGKALDFDGSAWWIRLKSGAKNSGELDMLPRNRFIKTAPPKYLWAIIVGVIILFYLIFQFTRIVGVPSLAVTFPPDSPYTTTDNTLTLAGSSHNADSISLNGDPITINPDGSWQKGVLLQDGLNTFQVTAKKFLGGTTDVTEQIWYEGATVPGAAATATPTGTSSSPTTPLATSTPGTGSF
jgi:transcriptional regulator with XRE-family HTH domain